jgi:lipoprotein signal peptidase
MTSSKLAVATSLTLFLFAADAAAKTVVVAHTGAGAMSWSLFLGQPMEIVSTMICLFAVALTAYAVGGRCVWAGLACVLAGAVGNFYSELCYRGYVPDFITWSTHNFFITVNTADLTIALGLLLTLGALTAQALRSSGAVTLPVAAGAA